MILRVTEMKSLGSFIKLTRTALATIDQSINLLQNIKLYNFVTGGQRPLRMVN